MSAQSRNKTLIFIIILLLITNIGVLSYFLFFCKKSQGKDNFATVLQKEVGFNKDQVAQFRQLKKTHWARAKAQMDEIVKIKNALYDLHKQASVPDSIPEKLADSIGNLQKQVEINVYHHLSALRKICTPEQQPALDSLMKKIINKGRPRTPDHNTKK